MMNNVKMKVVCYARTSTLDQAKEEKASIPDQIKWAKELAEDKEWELLEEYIEPGVTGDVDFEKREATGRLLQDARPLNDPERKFDLVLIYHSSRLAREADIVLRFHRILAQNYQVQVYIRNAPIDPVDPEKYYWGSNYIQQVTASLAGVQDQQENVARGERVRSGFRGIAERGIVAFAPYGYIKVKKFDKDGNYSWHWKPDAKKMVLVQEIFGSYGEKGLSLRAIQQSLISKKIPSPSGIKGRESWTPATVKNILMNPTYIGKVRWGRKLGSKYNQGRTTNGRQKRVFSSPDKWVMEDSTNCPDVVDENLFYKVQERLKVRSKLYGRAIASSGLLTGIIKCGVCGRNCYHKNRTVKKKGKKVGIRSDYICQTYVRFGKNSCRRHVISANKITKILLKEIDKLIKKAQKKKKLFYTGDKGKKGIWQKNLELLETDIERLETENRRLLRAYTAGRITLEEYGEMKDRLDKETLEKRGFAEKLRQKINDQVRAKEAEKKFVIMLKNFRKEFEKLDIKKQKVLVSSLVESISVGKNGKIDIKYRI
ncbi:recombinase family protein [Patescibacteria group bacterium]